jgi:hypothetical protein
MMPGPRIAARRSWCGRSRISDRIRMCLARCATSWRRRRAGKAACGQRISRRLRGLPTVHGLVRHAAHLSPDRPVLRQRPPRTTKVMHPRHPPRRIRFAHPFHQCGVQPSTDPADIVRGAAKVLPRAPRPLPPPRHDHPATQRQPLSKAVRPSASTRSAASRSC